MEDRRARELVRVAPPRAGLAEMHADADARPLKASRAVPGRCRHGCHGWGEPSAETSRRPPHHRPLTASVPSRCPWRGASPTDGPDAPASPLRRRGSSAAPIRAAQARATTTPSCACAAARQTPGALRKETFRCPSEETSETSGDGGFAERECNARLDVDRKVDGVGHRHKGDLAQQAAPIANATFDARNDRAAARRSLALRLAAAVQQPNGPLADGQQTRRRRATQLAARSVHEARGDAQHAASAHHECGDTFVATTVGCGSQRRLRLRRTSNASPCV